MQTCINDLISYYLELFNVYEKIIHTIRQQFLNGIRKLRESTNPKRGIKIFYFLYRVKRGLQCNTRTSQEVTYSDTTLKHIEG